MTSTECFLEILDKLQVLVDNSEPDCPTILVGDMNTCLPDEPQLDSGWYKRRPYSERNLILYNFLSNNNLCVGNFNFAQKVNFTYQRSNARSYIDHVFAPEYIMNSIEACTIIEEDANNISDHLPLSTVIMLKSLQSKHDDVSFPRPKWHDSNFQNLYCDEVRRRLMGLTYPDIQRVTVDTALGYINQLCEDISDILHQCVKNCLNQKPPRKTRHNKSWWNRDCDKAKQRNQVFHRIWKECACPTTGEVYNNYKLAKTNYKKICKLAMNGRIQTTLHTLNKLFHTKKPSEMWKLIRKSKTGDGSCNKDIINMDALCNHFSAKFTMISNGRNNDTIRVAKKELKKSIIVYVPILMTQRLLYQNIK